jgi:two-component system, LytTR family, response regulator
LKPFDAGRLLKTVGRAKRQVRAWREGGEDERLRALLREIKAGPKHLKRLAVKSNGRTVFLAVDEIDYVEAAGNYLRLQAGAESHMIRERLSQLEAKLDPERFARIHRSTIVNVERIKEMQPLFSGDQIVVLRNGKKLTMSRSFRDRLTRLLENL